MALQVGDVQASGAFYDAVLAPLGYVRVPPFGREIGFGLPGRGHWSEGTSVVQFSIGPSTASGTGHEVHVAFVAATRDQVLQFRDAALAFGAEVLNEPRVFPEYHEAYFAAFVRDPDGNKVEAVCHDPE